jgi:hypothetical protein
MKIVQSIVDGAFRLAIARSRRGGRRFAFNRAFSTSKIDVSKSIKSNRRDRIRPITRNHTQSNAIQRNPIRSNPPLDRADLRRREIRPIDRPSPRLRPTAARVRSREPSLDVARVATFAARRVAIRRARARECGRARRPRRRARRRARASVRVKFSRAVSRARERDGASASASRASISRARRRAAPP